MSENEKHASQTFREGSAAEMIDISLPIVVSQACYAVMTFTDRLFLSKLGSAEMSASMGGGLTVFMMLTFFFGLVGYTTAMVAQYFGAGRKNKCSIVLTQAMIISLVAYPLIILAKPLGFALFERMGIDPGQLHYQKVYFGILIYGSVITLVRTAFSGFFSGIGRTGVVMKSSFVAMLVNVAVNYVLIFGKFGFPALGIKGAAYGTIIGGLCGVLVLLRAYLEPRNFLEYGVSGSFAYSAGVMRKLLGYGYPAGTEIFLNVTAFNILIMLFHSHGAATATAVTIVLNWNMISFIPLIGIGIGVTSLVGRYMGAGQVEVAEKSVFSGLKIALVYSGFIFVCFFLFAPALVAVFAPRESAEIFSQAAPTAVFMLRLTALCVSIDAVIIVFIGALRGAGDTFGAMVLSVSMHLLLPPVLYVMLRVLNLSPKQGWMAVVAVFFLFSFLIYRRYRSGKWKKIKMVDYPEKTDFFPDEVRGSSDL